MIMKLWILLAVAALLLFWMISRERFEPTQSIKAPPYDDQEKKRMFGMVQNSFQAKLIRQATQQDPGLVSDRNALEIKAGGIVSPIVAEFYEAVFRGATTPITNAQIDAFIRDTPPGENIDIYRDILKTYFIGQSGVGTSERGPTGSTYADALARLGQGPGYLHTGTGSTGTSSTEVGSTTESSDSEATSTVREIPRTAGTGTASSAGSSSMSRPSITPSQKSKIYGPEFTELGSPIGNGNGRGSSGQYPEIWGGGGTDSNAMVGTSSQGGGSVVMPPMSSLGLDSNAMYFPYSRTPGDMDKIPDPYRVSQTWLPSKYGYNKTEPAPFLTDFSAFLK